jgi:hypothetical protein
VSSEALFHHHSTHGAMVYVVTGHIQLDTSVFKISLIMILLCRLALMIL